MKAVDSSHLDSIGYDPKGKVLTIRFKNGSVYQYSQVPEDQYRALMSSESTGVYFARNIKKRFKNRKL